MQVIVQINSDGEYKGMMIVSAHLDYRGTRRHIKQSEFANDAQHNRVPVLKLAAWKRTVAGETRIPKIVHIGKGTRYDDVTYPAILRTLTGLCGLRSTLQDCRRSSDTERVYAQSAVSEKSGRELKIVHELVRKADQEDLIQTAEK